MFRGFDTAEADQSLAAGFDGREAALKIFFDRHFEMGGDFCIEVGIALRLLEKGPHAIHGFPCIARWRRVH
jgi:hypothetical protein